MKTLTITALIWAGSTTLLGTENQNNQGWLAKRSSRYPLFHSGPVNSMIKDPGWFARHKQEMKSDTSAYDPVAREKVTEFDFTCPWDHVLVGIQTLGNGFTREFAFICGLFEDNKGQPIITYGRNEDDRKNYKAGKFDKDSPYKGYDNKLKHNGRSKCQNTEVAHGLASVRTVTTSQGTEENADRRFKTWCIKMQTWDKIEVEPITDPQCTTHDTDLKGASEGSVNSPVSFTCPTDQAIYRIWTDPNNGRPRPIKIECCPLGT